MSDKNLISFKELMDDVEAGYEPVKTVHLYGRDIEIKRHLNLAETLSFVSDVIDLCYVSTSDDSDDVGVAYTPELKEYAIAVMTVAYYTNIDLNVENTKKKKGKKKNIDADYTPHDFIIHSNIVSAIINEIEIEEYEKILKSIDEKIKYINDSKMVEISKEFKEFNNAMEDFVPAVKALASIDAEQMNDMMKKLLEAQDNNAIIDLAIKETKSNNPEIIEFIQKESGDSDGVG